MLEMVVILIALCSAYVAIHVVGPGRQPPELAQHQPGQARGEDRLAGRGPPYRVEELVVAGRLDQVPGGAGLDRLEHVALLPAGRQNEDVGLRPAGKEALDDLHAGQVGQLQVEHDHVRAYRGGDPDRLTDLGGAASIASTPGQGTEVELRVPRPR